MSPKIEFAGNILAEILNFILAVAAMTLIFVGFLGYQPGILRVLLLVLVPVFYYLIRKFCNNALLFFLLHFLAAAGVMALYSRRVSEIVVFGIFSILFALFSIAVKLSGKKIGMSPMNILAAEGFFFVLYLIDSQQTEGVCASRIIQMMIIYVIIYFLHYYLVNFDLYIDLSNRTTEHISSGRAFGASFGLATGFLGISGLVISLISDRQLADRIGSVISSFLKSVILFLASLFPEWDPGEDIPMSGGMEKADVPQMIEAFEDTEPSLLVKIIEGLFYVAAIIVIVALAAAAIIGIIRFLKSVFGMRMKKETVEKLEENDKVESLILTKKEKGEEKRERFSGFGRNPNQSVRKMYLKTLCKKYSVLKEEKTEKLLLKGTAKECCTALFSDKGKEAAEFSALYERARYSDTSCNKEDVKKMKHLAAQLFK